MEFDKGVPLFVFVSERDTIDNSVTFNDYILFLGSFCVQRCKLPTMPLQLQEVGGNDEQF